MIRHSSAHYIPVKTYDRPKLTLDNTRFLQTLGFTVIQK